MAGIITSLSVEYATHVFSTLDVHAKTTKNFSLGKFFRTQGLSSLMNGFQPMVYGAVPSAYIHYTLYKGVKEFLKGILKKYTFDEKSLTSIAIMSSGATALCELLSIILYYPFDLIKARMQRSGKYKYNNTTDALYKISRENNSKNWVLNFYRGSGIYAMMYGTFTILEFTLYEIFLAAITNFSKRYNQEISKKFEETHEHAKYRDIRHVII